MLAATESAPKPVDRANCGAGLVRDAKTLALLPAYGIIPVVAVVLSIVLIRELVTKDDSG